MTKIFDDIKNGLIEAIQLTKKDKMKDKNKNLQEELESIGMINNVDKLNIEDGIRGSAQMALSTALKDSQRHRKAAKEMNDKQETEARKALSREISNKEHPEPLDYLKPNSQIELKESLYPEYVSYQGKKMRVQGVRPDGKYALSEPQYSGLDITNHPEYLIDVSKEKIEPLEESAELVTEDISDGWDDELIFDIDGADVLEDIEGLIYEIRKTVRGYQSGAYTYEELGEYISDLASSLSYFAEGVSKLAESEDNEVEDTKMSLTEDTTEVSYTADSEGVVVDKELPAHEKASIEETPTSQQNGIQNMLQFLIKDEWDAIEGYNNTIQTLKSENAEDDILGVLQEISNEELVHVGQLQKLLELVNPITSKIKEGEAEATEQISDDPVQQDVATESEDNSDIHTESLIERELSTKENSISKIFIDNKDKINATTTKQSLVDIIKDLLKDLNPSRTDRIFKILDSKKDYFSALQYIYDFILKGDDFGVIK